MVVVSDTLLVIRNILCTGIRLTSCSMQDEFNLSLHVRARTSLPTGEPLWEEVDCEPVCIHGSILFLRVYVCTCTALMLHGC